MLAMIVLLLYVITLCSSVVRLPACVLTSWAVESWIVSTLYLPVVDDLLGASAAGEARQPPCVDPS